MLFTLKQRGTELPRAQHQPESRSYLSRNVTVSIVLYQHGLAEVRSLLEAIATDKGLSKCVVVNNGGSEEACKFGASLGFQCVQPERNLGFGSAHNVALRKLCLEAAPYHLFLNPDISLQSGTLSELALVLDTEPQVGILMPRVLYPDGSTQYLCKLLPTPVDLFLRRFAIGPLRRLFEERMLRYDMQQFDYSRPAYVPVLSGCFMLTRRAVIDSIGGFDERFFLYMEDTDLCRRVGDRSRLLFWPWITVVHRHAQGSYKSLYLLRLHIRSAIAYFNKWGWFRDPVRTARNNIGLEDAANHRFRE